MATKFLDGPAKDVRLSLSHAPAFLRVVTTGANAWDALDNPEDAPAPNEEVFVYALKGAMGGAFIDGRDPKTGKRFGRYEQINSYAFHDVQPSKETLRDKALWKAWCEQQPGKPA